MNKKHLESNRYILRLILGIVLLTFIIFYQNTIKSENLIEKAQKLNFTAGFEIFTPLIIMTGYIVSAIMILTGIIFYLIKFFRK